MRVPPMILRRHDLSVCTLTARVSVRMSAANWNANDALSGSSAGAYTARAERVDEW